MAAARPTVTVYNKAGQATGESIPLPDVFLAPIRKDLVSKIHALLHQNTRQPYAVSEKAGHQTSAESWGTGRAVARIPRVRGGGTHRSGQAAYGNMCRGGRMFAPTHPWRKWHHHVNKKQRHYALSSAVAATAIPGIVEAKGHVISHVAELPLVVEGIESFTKTKEAISFLRAVRAYDDVVKSIASKRLRAGKGKMRNRRYKQKRGPLLVFKETEKSMVKAFRNVPGLNCMSTSRMNLLRLAPGGHVGRFVIWTRAAFEDLDKFFGLYSSGTSKLPMTIMETSDIRAIIKNLASRNAVRAPVYQQPRHVKRGNPLKNKQLMTKLNPGWKSQHEITVAPASK